jgi:hypothetical protein
MISTTLRVLHPEKSSVFLPDYPTDVMRKAPGYPGARRREARKLGLVE